MRPFLRSLALAGGIFAALTLTTSAQVHRNAAADQSAVTDTMRAMYVAVSMNNAEELHAVTAPEFYAFDGGTAYSSIDALVQALNGYRRKGAVFVWNVTEPHVTVYGNEAWITYVNDGSIQMPDAAPTPTKWLESAVLEKRQGAWRIVFFHSSRVQPPPPS